MTHHYFLIVDTARNRRWYCSLIGRVLPAKPLFADAHRV